MCLLAALPMRSHQFLDAIRSEVPEAFALSPSLSTNVHKFVLAVTRTPVCIATILFGEWKKNEKKKAKNKKSKQKICKLWKEIELFISLASLVVVFTCQ